MINKQVGIRVKEEEMKIVEEAMKRDPRLRSYTDVFMYGLSLVKREMKIGDTFAPPNLEVQATSQ